MPLKIKFDKTYVFQCPLSDTEGFYLLAWLTPATKVSHCRSLCNATLLSRPALLVQENR